MTTLFGPATTESLSSGKWRSPVHYVVVAACIPVVLYAYSSGPPPRKTGAPGDAGTCASCHGKPDGGNFQVAFPDGLFYTPGVQQTFTITITEPDPVTDGYGFEMSARLESDLANAQAGDFTAGEHQQVICDHAGTKPAGGCPSGNTVEFIEQSSLLIANTIPVVWTAPATNAGNVYIYVAVVAGTGDCCGHVYSASYVLAPRTTGPTPQISSAGVVNGASFTSGIQSNSWITIEGSNLAGNSRIWNAATEIVNGKLPAALDGVSVTVDNRPASIYYISPTQINALAPDDVNLGTVSVQVTNGNGTSNTGTAQLQKFSPGFFMFDPQGRKYIAALIARSDGGVDYLGPVGLFGSALATRPVKPGEIVELYGTGFGPTNPPVPSGAVFTGAAPLTDPTAVTVTIGGVQASVQFAGMTGAGLYQINAVVPALADGDQKVAATIGGLSTQDNAFITVKN